MVLRMARRRTPPAPPATVAAARAAKPRCGLCGKTARLTQTECCGNWICDDEANYVMFSYARNSCDRNHRRYTLCGYHHNEEHAGSWQECAKCRKDFEAEDYVYYTTNEHNFETLANLPAFEPTRCVACGVVIRRGYEGHSRGPDGFRCEACAEMQIQQLQKAHEAGQPRNPPPPRTRAPRKGSARRKKAE